MWLEGWNFGSTPTPPWREEELMVDSTADDLINPAYVMRLPEKPKRTGFRELPGW